LYLIEEVGLNGGESSEDGDVIGEEELEET